MDNKTRGTVAVSKRALMQIVWYIAKSHDGIDKVTDTANKRNFTSRLFKKGEPDGVYIKRTKSGIFVDVYVILKSGAEADNTAKSVSEKVKEATSGMGISISEVIVHVQGIKE